MIKPNLNVSRRKFMVASSAAIAAPILKNMAGMVPDASGAEKKYDFIEEKKCDLVVIGGGASGMVGAARAAQLTGKKIIVLEKDSEIGGGGRHANGIRTFGSKWQADRDIPDTTMEYAREMMDSVYWRLDEKLVGNLLRGTGRFFDWLCAQRGDIEDLFDIRQIDEGPLGPDMNIQKSGKNLGLFIVDMMKEKCEKHEVEVLTKHPVVDVEVTDGKIAAAVAKSEAGYIRVPCKACIMSIGSWINNEEIVKKYAPEFAGMTKYLDPNDSLHWNPNYTGDGIFLAEKVGAFLDYDSFCLRLRGPKHSMGMIGKVFNAMSQSQYIITVNLNGKRYCSEPISHMGEFGGGQVQIHQPRGMSYDIFDENTIAAALKLQKSTPSAEQVEPMMPMMGPGFKSRLPDTMEDIHRDIEESVAKNTRDMFKADSLEALADKIGVKKKNFLETVKNYNESCERGADWEFFKSKEGLVPINKPPYYAFLGTLGTDGAFGGVRVNPNIQAYKAGGGLVEGLYVTGDFASGRHINLGGVKHQVITDLSWAFTSGFLAGTNAGKYLESLG